MKVLFLLNGLASLAILAFLIVVFARYFKRGDLDRDKVVRWFAVVFFVQIILFVLHSSWFFSFFEYHALDFTLIYSLAVFVQTLVLFKAFNSFSSSKKSYVLLLFYFVLLLLIDSFSFQFILIFSLIISSLLVLTVSFRLLFRPASKKSGYLATLYASVSTILYFLLLLNVGDILLFALISNALFFLFCIVFINYVRECPPETEDSEPLKGGSKMMLFIEYFVYIIVITNFVLISTVGVHELGHVLVSRYYGCDSRAIVFEEGSYPYSEILCNDLAGKMHITLAGPLIPIIAALVLLIFGGKVIWPISFLIMGFNFLVSGKDLLELGVRESIILTVSIVGIIFLFVGIAFLARSRMQEYRDNLV